MSESGTLTLAPAPAPAPADTPTDLKPLKELPLPAPVSYAPQTIGWLGVLIVLVAIAAVGAWLFLRRRRKQRYRREALAELERIAARLNDAAAQGAALAEIPRLLKRTSLAVLPREQVASLTGNEWLAFLKRTHDTFDERSGALLSLVSYAPAPQLAALSRHDVDSLLSAARDWIEHHHVEV